MRIFCVVFLLVAVLTGALAETSTQTVKEERRQILQFGIEPEVLELMQLLLQEKNMDYHEDLLVVYRTTKSSAVREQVLRLFLDLKDTGLQDQAIEEIANPDKKTTSFLLTAVSYLTDLKISKAEETFAQRMNDKNKMLALACIRALGKIQATSRIPDILKLYQDGETDPNFKPDIIWTLGELKAHEAVDALLKEYDDNDSQPLLQRAILETLGKIGDDKAWDRIEKALTSGNVDLRSAAISTLPSFPGRADQTDLLLGALRDAQPGVRLAAAETAEKLKLSNLADILLFRVKKDPDPKVRVACLKAIGVLDLGPQTLLTLLADRKTDFTVWKEALDQSLKRKIGGVADVLKKLITEENKDKTGSLAPFVAGALLPLRDDYREVFALLLLNDKSPARMLALRAIGAGNYHEYESSLTTLSTKDPDPEVKALCTKILKEWGVNAAETAKK